MLRVIAAGTRIERLRLAVVPPAVLIGLLSLGGGAAAAPRRIAGHAGQRAWASQITSPSSSNAVFLSSSTQAVVRVASGVRSFQAWLGTQSITRSFRTADAGSTRVATLRIGSTPVLQFGRDTLYVRTSSGTGRRWSTQRSFVMARPASGLLNTATAQAGCGTGADVRVALARPGVHNSSGHAVSANLECKS